MKHAILLTLGLALVMPVQAAKGRAEGPAKGKANPAKVFKKLDTDGDGSLSKAEFAARAGNNGQAGKLFQKKDKDNDGKLSLAEFTAKGNDKGRKKNHANKQGKGRNKNKADKQGKRHRKNKANK